MIGSRSPVPKSHPTRRIGSDGSRVSDVLDASCRRRSGEPATTRGARTKRWRPGPNRGSAPPPRGRSGDENNAVAAIEIANGNPRASVSVTPNSGPSHIYDFHPFGVWYGDGWAIFHRDIAPLLSGSASTAWLPMRYRQGRAPGQLSNVRRKSTYLDHPLTNGWTTALLMVTPKYNPHGAGGTYNNNHVGVWYDTV